MAPEGVFLLLIDLSLLLLYLLVLLLLLLLIMLLGRRKTEGHVFRRHGEGP